VCVLNLLQILSDLYSFVSDCYLAGQSAEVVSLKQEVERQKELDTAQELKTKWYLNQLNIETDAHKVHFVVYIVQQAIIICGELFLQVFQIGLIE